MCTIYGVDEVYWRWSYGLRVTPFLEGQVMVMVCPTCGNRPSAGLPIVPHVLHGAEGSLAMAGILKRVVLCWCCVPATGSFRRLLQYTESTIIRPTWL